VDGNASGLDKIIVKSLTDAGHVLVDAPDGFAHVIGPFAFCDAPRSPIPISRTAGCATRWK